MSETEINDDVFEYEGSGGMRQCISGHARNSAADVMELIWNSDGSDEASERVKWMFGELERWCRHFNRKSQELTRQLAAMTAERDALAGVVKQLSKLADYEAVEHREDDGPLLVGLASPTILGPLYDPTYEPYELCETVAKWLKDYVAKAVKPLEAK